MKCPKCQHEETKVLESRLSHEGRSVRRRRCCLQCNYRYTTYEKEEDWDIQIKKKDGRFESFSREKAAKAIKSACTKRAIGPDDIDSILQRIERHLQDSGARIVESKVIGDLIMDHLKTLDHVAYVRFASVYKDFKDSEEFLSEVRSLLKSDDVHQIAPKRDDQEPGGDDVHRSH